MDFSIKQIRRNRVFYGCGIIGTSIFDTFIGSFLTLYATDVLGLDALYFASLLLFPKIVDIVIDFFIMYFVGKTKSRFGMYRPWLLNMLGLVICFVILFSAPVLVPGESVPLAIILVCYFLSDSIFASFYWIPYAAIPGVMTEDENELVKITSSRTIYDYIFSLLVSGATMPILLAFGGHKNPKGWMVASLIFGLLSLLSSAACFVLIKTNPELEKKMTKDYSFADVLRDYKAVLGEKSFLTMTVLLCLLYLTIYTHQTVSYYFYIYNMNAEEFIGFFALIGAAVSVSTSFLSGRLQKRFGFKGSLVLGAVLMFAAAVLMMLCYNLAVLILSGCVMVVGTTLSNILLDSLWPVIAQRLDTDKVKTPLNSTIGLSSVLGSSAIILGNTLGAAIVSFSRYDPELATQQRYTLDCFRYISPTITILLSLGMIVLILVIQRKGEALQNEGFRGII